MRLLLASVATLAAVALAVPASAQDAAPIPTPIAKPKQGTVAYCNSLKSASSKSACLKRVQAQAKAPTSTKTTKKTKAKKPEAPKTDNSAEAGAPAPSSAQMPPQTISVPPLPHKTI
ncbi:MAG TPA: hypothetical protein VEC60_17935 [Reyranella sp.]|nr:hypothetical protein [Reyranella sp.]